MQYHTLSFGPGKNNEREDFRIISSQSNGKFDFLIFSDSRGSVIEGGRQKGCCWPDLLIERLLEKGLSYLFVSRPKDLTVFFTLLNFLHLNDLKFQFLVTNVGFVDFTPKKRSFSDDIFIQSPPFIDRSKLILKQHGSYRLSDGSEEILNSYEYDDIFRNIANVLDDKFEKCALISTREVSPNIKIERQRPASFFEQLKSTNLFLASIEGASRATYFIDPYKGFNGKDEDISFDGVHFNEYGHRLIAESVIRFIDAHFLVQGK